MKFDLELFETQEEVRKYIQECRKVHMMQVAYSAYHDSLTQICYGCRKVRTNIYMKYPEVEDEQKVEKNSSK